MDPRRLNVLLGHLDAYIQDIENFTMPAGEVRRIVNIQAVTALAKSNERLGVAVAEAQLVEYGGADWPETAPGVFVSPGTPHGTTPAMLPLSIVEQVLLSGPGPQLQLGDEIPESSLAQLRGARNALAEAIPVGDALDSCSIAAALDFTWLRVGGERYRFSKGHQAEIIRILYAAWERAGEDGYGESEAKLEAIIEAGTGFRVTKTFAGHPALNRILRSPTKGTWALYLNENRK